MSPCKDCRGHLQTIAILQTKVFNLEEKDTTIPWTPKVKIPRDNAKLMLASDTETTARLKIAPEYSHENHVWNKRGDPKAKQKSPM